MKRLIKGRQMERHCKHCKAPVKSVFEGPPLLPKLEEKNYLVQTDQYNIQHIYDQVKKDPPKEVKQKQAMKEWLKTMSMCSKMSDNPLLHNWSGYTFMTEHENERIEKAYLEAKLDSKVDRVVWRAFHKKMKKHQYREKTTNAGPEWFQDMAAWQIKLVDNLEKMLEADLREGHSGRTQQFLYDLGIWPGIANNLVTKAIKASGGKAIPFLFQIHQEIVTVETPEYEKKFYEAKKMKMTISPYSINERLVLTAVFQYHYPDLLKKLDQLLPPPYKEPPVLLGKKPIRKKEKYSSPYLEPLPINEKPWYEQREEEELEKKVMRKVIREKERVKNARLKERMRQQDEKVQKKLDEAKKRPSEDKTKGRILPGSINMSLFDEDDLVNLAALPPRERKSFFFKKYSECLTNYIEASDEQEMVEEEEDEEPAKDLLPSPSMEAVAPPNSPSGSQEKSTVLSDKLPAHSGMSSGIRSTGLQKEENEVSSSSQSEKGILRKREKQKKQQLKFANANLLTGVFGTGSKTDGTHITKCLLDTEVENISEDIHLIKVPSLVTPRTSSEETVEEFKLKNFWVPLDITYKELTSVSRISLRSQETMVKEMPYYQLRRMSGPPLPDLTVLKNAKRLSKSFQKESIKMDKPYVVECTEPGCAIVENLDEPLSEFEFARRRIQTLPPKKQLTAALRFLCDKGDPLAVLPKMELVPWLVRWFDARRGIKRVLTQKDKDELLAKSQNMWNAEYTSPTAAPVFEIPDQSFPWSHKKSVTKMIDTNLYNHRRAIKHILIDNARDLFPTMFSEYFNTPLNKSFRKTFYAYFPACERDCILVRPWDPNEDKEEKHKVVVD